MPPFARTGESIMSAKFAKAARQDPTNTNGFYRFVAPIRVSGHEN
jgi:hypothetical protein